MANYAANSPRFHIPQLGRLDFAVVMPLSLRLLICLSAVLTGCMGPAPQFTLRGDQATVGNPLFIGSSDQEYVWEHVATVLHEFHFEIERENKLDGLLETGYRTGSGLLEPWHADSMGFENRAESTFQSIRRRVFVHVTPAEGGFLVSIEAHKELEDLVGVAANSAGSATFQESTPLQRDLDVVVGQSAPSGWIPQGRDPLLEQAMLQTLQRELRR